MPENIYLGIAWSYCLLSVNHHVPGVVSKLYNKNTTAVLSMVNFHAAFALLMVPLGVAATLNFGGDMEMLY